MIYPVQFGVALDSVKSMSRTRWAIGRSTNTNSFTTATLRFFWTLTFSITGDHGSKRGELSLLSTILHCSINISENRQSKTAKCLFHKDLDKVKILETLIAASKPRPYTLVEQQKVGHDHDETTIYNYEISGSASTMKEVAIGPSNRNARTEAVKTFEPDWSPSLPAKERRRQTRSMLGPAHHHVEESVNPKQSETMEDIVEMDYAQPHRKPPIHNEKP